MNRYIMVGWGICEKYQSRDSQISRAGTAREILSSDWNFSQLPSSIVIFLFNYTKYTFIPWRMCLHKKGVSWTWNTIIFIWKHIFFMRMQQERMFQWSLSAIFVDIWRTCDAIRQTEKPWENRIIFGTKGHARIKKANPKM